MARRPKYPGGTKNKFLESATKLFLENGYEGTSVRSIVQNVDCEVGLFYYYYPSKDKLFSDVIEKFFAPYGEQFDKLVEHAKANPSDGLKHFFERFNGMVKTFSKKYSANLHKTTRWALSEHALNTIEPYVEKIVKLEIQNGAKPVIGVESLTVAIAHGSGSLIIKGASENRETLEEAIKLINVLMNK